MNRFLWSEEDITLEKKTSLANIFKHLPGQHSQQSHAGNLSPTDYVAQLSPEHQKAIYDYTSDKYKSINGGLRYGKELDKEDQERIRLIDEAIATAPPITQKSLFRALAKTPEEKGLIEGTIFTDKGFVSTTRDAMYMYKIGLQTRVTIKVPKGTKGLAVEKISFKKAEKEILLPRDSFFKVTKVSQNEHGSYDVTVELLP